MSERVNRVLLALILGVVLLLKSDLALYILGGYLLFEGLTNLRLTKIVSMIRYGGNYEAICKFKSDTYTINFEAERLIRFMIVLLVYVSLKIIPMYLWFFPYFIVFMLTFAGLTDQCPMLLLFRKIGFR